MFLEGIVKQKEIAVPWIRIEKGLKEDVGRGTQGQRCRLLLTPSIYE